MSGRRRTAALAAGGALTGAALAYAHLIEPRWIGVERWAVRIPDLPPAWEGLRLVQLSDFQEGMWLQDRRLTRRAVARALAERPDAVFLTGDFEDDGRPHARGEPFRALSAAAPTYAVLGNHDHAAGDAATRALVASLEAQGVRVLVNSHAWYRFRGVAWMVVGVDDLATNHTDFLRAITGIPRDTRLLALLTHVPEVAAMAPRGWFPLALAGHTHGAQVALMPRRLRERLPLLPLAGGARYERAWYDVNGTLLYVNRGIGTSTLPLRLGARPEVTLFVLTGGALTGGARLRRLQPAEAARHRGDCAGDSPLPTLDREGPPASA